MKRKTILKPGIFILLAIIVVGLFAALTAMGKEPVKQEPQPRAQTAAPKDTAISLLCAGDIMVHRPQLNAQYNAKTHTYDFDNNFKYVKPYIEKADLAMCNLETTFAGKPYTGYPVFSSPDSLATAIKNAGFDVALTANNHMMDKGLPGLERTLKVLKKTGIGASGTRAGKTDPTYLIRDVKGVKIGIIAYTFETGSGQGSTAINGTVISNNAAAHLNSFNFNTLKTDIPKIRRSVQGARAAGAQIVVVYYHWGEEYQRSANAYQKELARKTAAMGADIIFASHPHVVQPAVYLKAPGGARKVPVFYSLGNFLSNQRMETLGNRYTEEGFMAQVNLTYSQADGIKTISMTGIPTWVDKYTANGKVIYAIIPLDKKLKQNAALAVSGHLSRAKQALEDSNGIFKHQ